MVGSPCVYGVLVVEDVLIIDVCSTRLVSVFLFKIVLYCSFRRLLVVYYFKKR